MEITMHFKKEMLEKLDSEFEYQRWRAALLLLGLRDPDVDRRLEAFVTQALQTFPSSTQEEAQALRLQHFQELLKDRSIARCDFSCASPVTNNPYDALLPYAWLTPTAEEIEPLFEVLQARAKLLSEPVNDQGAEFYRRLEQAQVWLLLCDFIRSYGRVEHHSILNEMPCKSTMAHALRSVSLGQTPPRPSHEDTFFWDSQPTISSLFQRDAATLSFNRGTLELLKNKSPSRWILMVNIDGMMCSNDIFGFQVGDQMIQSVTDTLHRIVGDRVLRHSGDQWVVFSDQSNPKKLAEHIVKTIAQSPMSVKVEDCYGSQDELPEQYTGARLTDQGLYFTVSVGLSSHPELTTSLEQADLALYAAKKAGRNRVAMAQPSQMF